MRRSARAAALGAVALMALPVSACRDGDGDGEAGSVEALCEQLGRRSPAANAVREQLVSAKAGEVLVYFDPGASRDDVDEIRRQIRILTPGATVEPNTPDEDPFGVLPSYHVRQASGPASHLLIDKLDDLPAVVDVATAARGLAAAPRIGDALVGLLPDRVRFEVRLYLKPGVAANVIERLRSEIAERRGVEEVEFSDQEAAYEEFKELFADNPELLADVGPEILPASLDVQGAADLDIGGLLAAFERDPAVFDIIEPLREGAGLVSAIGIASASDTTELEMFAPEELDDAVDRLGTAAEQAARGMTQRVDLVGSSSAAEYSPEEWEQLQRNRRDVLAFASEECGIELVRTLGSAVFRGPDG